MESLYYIVEAARQPAAACQLSQPLAELIGMYSIEHPEVLFLDALGGSAHWGANLTLAKRLHDECKIDIGEVAVLRWTRRRRQPGAANRERPLKELLSWLLRARPRAFAWVATLPRAKHAASEILALHAAAAGDTETALTVASFVTHEQTTRITGIAIAKNDTRLFNSIADRYVIISPVHFSEYVLAYVPSALARIARADNAHAAAYILESKSMSGYVQVRLFNHAIKHGSMRVVRVMLANDYATWQMISEDTLVAAAEYGHYECLRLVPLGARCARLTTLWFYHLRFMYERQLSRVLRGLCVAMPEMVPLLRSLLLEDLLPSRSVPEELRWLYKD